MPYTIIFEPDTQETKVQAVIDRLLSWSRSTEVLHPGKRREVCSAKEVSAAIRHWPAWWSHPWIIGGGLHQKDAKHTYTGPFIEDCVGTGYDEQCQQLMANYDWAVFSYFKTYQDGYYTFIIRLAELHAQFVSHLDAAAVIENYPSYPTQLSDLRNASFSDYDEEGLFALRLASEAGEPLPLILCAIEDSSPGLYCGWDIEKDDYDGILWYEEPLKQLDQVEEFIVKDHHNNTTCYQVYRATDLEAYRALWAMTSRDGAIAEATPSADCDLPRLKTVLETGGLFVNQVRHVGPLCSWVYGQIYGGGSDEHLAIFHAQNPAATQRIWELAIASDNKYAYPISRF
jgi:hypothetical protein